MPKYILMLGQASDLAKLEIWSVFDSVKKSPNFGQNFGILESTLTAEEIIKKLGGTIKVAEYIDELPELLSINENWWLKQIKANKKINFGFSLYNDQAKNYQKIKKIALAVKKNLSQSGQAARLVTSQSAELSSVIVTKNKLINNELIFIYDQNRYLVGRTLAVQDFADYAQRDMDRPGRDDCSGMLPPKVAKMLVNLGGSKKETILDPFCGSGTVLQEAILLGYTKIYGTDSSAKACQDSKNNLAWLQKKYNLQFDSKIYQADARKLSQYLSLALTDCLISEPYMGPAKEIIKNNKLDYFLSLQQELSQLYVAAFKEFKKILKPGAKIVFVFPIFNLNDRQIHTLDVKSISRLGYTLVKIPLNLKQLSKNGQVVYQRPQQKVAREITIWQLL